MNYFLEGAPATQIQRAMEFACEYHMIEESNNPLPWLNIPRNQAFDQLQSAFFDSCVATQAAIIKALALIKIFDDCPPHIIQGFIDKASGESQAPYISDAIRRLQEVSGSGLTV